MGILPSRLCRACHAEIHAGDARWELHDRTLFHPHVYCLTCVRLSLAAWGRLNSRSDYVSSARAEERPPNP